MSLRPMRATQHSKNTAKTAEHIVLLTAMLASCTRTGMRVDPVEVPAAAPVPLAPAVLALEPPAAPVRVCAS